MPKEPKRPPVVLGRGPFYKLAATCDGKRWTARLSVWALTGDHVDTWALNAEIAALPPQPFERETIAAAHAYLRARGFGEMDPRRWFERA